ncbi:MAG: DUF2817 domain-containing protein [Bacteriovoracaceae bacterium]|nr:DUF2817 domain-containing protein [Bacteriovoracaceae bacterium]
MKKIFLLILVLLSIPTLFAQDVSEGVYVKKTNESQFNLLKSRNEFTIDHISEQGFELYGPVGTSQFLKFNNIEFEFLKKIPVTIAATYPSPEEIELELKSLTSKYSSISKMFSIGNSVKKRSLWVIKISKNVGVNDHRPEFKYIANMHGDEIVGRELMVRFIKDLLSQYGKDQQITNLIDRAQIYIMPSMNPDGAANKNRGNANSIDLNRNFPDFSTNDNKDTTLGRQPETQAVMNWQTQRNFKLSANFHGGAEVVNYPWDTSASKFPEQDYLKELSLEYAGLTPYIAMSSTFKNGITNGYAWYEVNGGMQDWSLYYKKDLQLTIELSNPKWPEYDKIDFYYQENKIALLNLIQRVL